MPTRKKPVFVLDHNFPEHQWTVTFPDIEFAPLRDVHPDLVAGRQDWDVLRKLKARGGVAGFVTLDARMLRLPREMVVLQQTRLTLVVFEDVHNDPITAWGLLIATSSEIAKKLDRRRATVFRIHPPRLNPTTPFALLTDIAAKTHVDVQTLDRPNRLTPLELADAT